MYFLNDERNNILNKTVYLTKANKLCEDMSVYIMVSKVEFINNVLNYID